MTEFKIVDCRGLPCPQPVIDTKDALQGAAAPFRVIVDSAASCANVRRFAESQGAIVTVAEQQGGFHLTIDPGRRPASAEAPPIVCSGSASGRAVVYVASEGMGRGDDALGDTLMAAFLDTLSHFKGEVSHAVFVNAGVKLAIDGSPVLDQLRHLEETGAQVLVCGTCLSHFGVKDKLAVGAVSNMYVIIETLLQAGSVIRP